MKSNMQSTQQQQQQQQQQAMQTTPQQMPQPQFYAPQQPFPLQFGYFPTAGGCFPQTPASAMAPYAEAQRQPNSGDVTSMLNWFQSQLLMVLQRLHTVENEVSTLKGAFTQLEESGRKSTEMLLEAIMNRNNADEQKQQAAAAAATAASVDERPFTPSPATISHNKNMTSKSLDEQDRARSLMLYGFPQQESETPEVLKEAVTTFFLTEMKPAELIATEPAAMAKEMQQSIISVQRIGARDSVRPVKVTFSSALHRLQVHRQASKLASSKDSKKISIDSDLTQQQQRMRLQRREQLAEELNVDCKELRMVWSKTEPAVAVAYKRDGAVVSMHALKSKGKVVITENA
jgi:hypothetical protein